MKGLNMALMVPMSMGGKEVILADIIGSLGKHAAALDWQIWWWDGRYPRESVTLPVVELNSHFDTSFEPVSVSWPDLEVLASQTTYVSEGMIIGLAAHRADSWIDHVDHTVGCDAWELRGAAEVSIEAFDDTYWEVQSAWLEDIDALRRHLQSLGLPCGIAGET